RRSTWSGPRTAPSPDGSVEMGQRQPSSFPRSQLFGRVVVQRGDLRYPRRVPSRRRLRNGFRGQGAGVRHRVLFLSSPSSS
ncbi:unnamed protein product, partial [Ectocarpus sp. 4 AP-2014]